MTFWRYDIVGRIAGPRAFSQRVFLPVLAFLSVGGAASESRATPDEIVGWNTVTFIALLGSWLLATISGAVVDRVFRRSGTPRFVAVIVVYFVVEASLAVLMAWLAFDRNLDPDPNWAYRIVAGGLTGLALFGVVAFVLAETDDYRATLGDLIVSARQMEELVSATEADLEVRRVQVLEAVRSAVTEAIRGVLTAGGSSARIVANELVRVSEEIVRPLSHSLIPAVALSSSSSERSSITKPGRINAPSTVKPASVGPSSGSVIVPRRETSCAAAAANTRSVNEAYTRARPTSASGEGPATETTAPVIHKPSGGCSKKGSFESVSSSHVEIGRSESSRPTRA